MLELTAQQDIGALGPASSQVVTLYWLPLFSYPSLVIWAVLLLALAAGGTGQDRRIWLVLIPAGLVHLIWHTIKVKGHFGVSEGLMIDQIILPLAIALALIFSQGQRISRVHHAKAFLWCAGVLVGIGFISFLAYIAGSPLVRTAWMSLVFYTILGTAWLLAMVLSARLSRRHYTRPGFALWVLVWIFVLTMALIFAFGWYDFRPRDLDGYAEVLGVGAVFGLSAYGVTLPFLILAFTSAYFRTPFQTCLGLKPIPNLNTEDLIRTQGDH